MGVYVDEARIPYRGVMRMSHMVADTEEELHAMADQLGLKREWFQGPPAHDLPHYDVAECNRHKAIRLGAKSITRRELMEFIRRQRSMQNA